MAREFSEFDDKVFLRLLRGRIAAQSETVARLRPWLESEDARLRGEIESELNAEAPAMGGAFPEPHDSELDTEEAEEIEGWFEFQREQHIDGETERRGTLLRFLRNAAFLATWATYEGVVKTVLETP